MVRTCEHLATDAFARVPPGSWTFTRCHAFATLDVTGTTIVVAERWLPTSLWTLMTGRLPPC